MVTQEEQMSGRVGGEDQQRLHETFAQLKEVSC